MTPAERFEPTQDALSALCKVYFFDDYTRRIMRDDPVKLLAEVLWQEAEGHGTAPLNAVSDEFYNDYMQRARKVLAALDSAQKGGAA